MADNRKYFFVKHGLDSLLAMPRFIWRTGEKHQPRGFKNVNVGDRWISFAYTTSDQKERPLSQITGFFECTRKSRFGKLPSKARQLGFKAAWMIEGKRFGKQPKQPVGVPPINDLLKRKTFSAQTLVPIRDAAVYERIRKDTLDHELEKNDIPLLGREPRNEQEVVAVVLACHKKLGIEKILRIRTGFPDMKVKLERRAEPVHLEIETYSKSFLLHDHDKHVRNRQFKTDERSEKLPVAILCWIDNDKSKQLTGMVHGVYALQQLIRDKAKIRW